MLFAKNKQGNVLLEASMVNRHGIIAGATGSGKTVTAKVMAEHLSDMGVPVFIQDVKGDLSGFAAPGQASKKFIDHISHAGFSSPDFSAYPTVFWDVFAKDGHAMRTTLTELGPMVLSQLLKLNDTQSAIMYSLFKLADDHGLMLLDFKDLMALINHVGLERKAYEQDYGMMSMQSIGAIKRKLLVFEQEGFANLLGEPAFDIHDLMRSRDNKGIINVLHAVNLVKQPALYASFLIWLLSEVYENLPEVGDLSQPKLVLFFDEAHLMFHDMPKFLEDRLAQMIKHIRSKGVGIYFITQNIADIPGGVLSQLANRVQHVMRAYTPKEQKSVKIACDAFRENPLLDPLQVIGNLGVGEALVSLLDHKGVPNPVERCFIAPPKSQFGPVEATGLIKDKDMEDKYATMIDRVSAFEMLKKRVVANQSKAEPTKEEKRSTGMKRRSSRSDSPFDKFLKSAASSIGRQLGQSLVRGLLGSLKKE